MPKLNLEDVSANLIVRCLSDKSEKDLKETIKKRINLADTLSAIIPSNLIKIIRVAASFYQVNGITPELVLRLLDMQRPDLVRVIKESKENYEWFKKNVRDCKRLFGI
jgi:hypothetical protein